MIKETCMKLVVCAKSNSGSFIGLPSAAGYTVFSAGEVDAVHPGDILANPSWDDEAGLDLEVKNLTTDETVRVRIVKWAITLDEARDWILARKSPETLVWHPPWPGR